MKEYTRELVDFRARNRTCLHEARNGHMIEGATIESPRADDNFFPRKFSEGGVTRFSGGDGPVAAGFSLRRVARIVIRATNGAG